MSVTAAVLFLAGLGLALAIFGLVWGMRHGPIARPAAADFEQYPVEAWPHVYIGPTNRYGLKHGTPCRRIGRRAGGVKIAVPGVAVALLVGPDELEVRRSPAGWADRTIGDAR